MDANGLRFWMLADAGHWPTRAHAVWDSECRTLQLASERSLPAPADPSAAFAAANSALERIPRAVDQFDARLIVTTGDNIYASKRFLLWTAESGDRCVRRSATTTRGKPRSMTIARRSWTTCTSAKTHAGRGRAPGPDGRDECLNPADWSAVSAESGTPDDGAPVGGMMRGTRRTRFVTLRRRP